MMRKIMERIPYSARRIDSVADLLGEHEGRDACDVRLPGQYLQIEHQFDMRLEIVRNSRWCGRKLESGRHLLCSQRDAPLDLADVRQITVEPRPIARGQRAL